MDKECLIEMLREASGGRGKEGVFRFDASRGATLLVSAGGTLLSVERVTRLAVKKGFVAAETERSERYLVDLASVVAVRLHAASEGSGFLGR